MVHFLMFIASMRFADICSLPLPSITYSINILLRLGIDNELLNRSCELQTARLYTLTSLMKSLPEHAFTEAVSIDSSLSFYLFRDKITFND